jgi:hypothetical protein
MKLARRGQQLTNFLQESNMSQPKVIFADSMGEITLSGGMVRIDLVTLVGSQSDEANKPHLEATHRVVMPPDGFLRSFSSMETLVKQLVDAGLVKPREGGNETPVTNKNGSGLKPKF